MRLKFVVAGLLASSVLLIVWSDSVGDVIQVTPRRNVKTILSWNRHWHQTYFFGGVGIWPTRTCKCDIKDCEFWDRHTGNPGIPYEQYDAILFFGHTQKGSMYSTRPAKRSSHQRYVYLNDEAPALYHNLDFTNLTHFFNWTMTYRRDSDVYIPYGFFYNSALTPHDYLVLNQTHHWMEPDFNDMKLAPAIRKKSKLAAWFVSNPYPDSKREEYVQSLSDYIPIDVYGKAGSLKCYNCDELLKTAYKFYLSFENALCEDYVTEKFFRAYMNDVVPVVYGKADYKSIAPPNSYIHVDQFRHPKELAKYLLYLDKHPEEYEKYFWWKKFYSVASSGMHDGLCTLCEILHRPNLPSKVYYDVGPLWKKKNVCQEPIAYLSERDD